MRDRGLGLCIIGRNEEGRLREALAAVCDRGERRVYVDSASTDRSIAVAQGFGDAIEVVRLDERPVCTAARGRNRGFEHLRRTITPLRYVQFIDGDCVLSREWIDTAMATLDARPEVAIVAGRLREEHRDRNVYHRLAEMEWREGGTGEVASVGGIFMVRAEVFREVGGMSPELAQGEEAELARRIRARGFRVVRLPDEMGRHDIDTERFGQWWARASREGRAAAECVRRHGSSDPYAVRHLISMAFWGAGLPAAASVLALPTLGLSSSLLLGHVYLWRRVRRARIELGDPPEDAALYAWATVLGKVANASGLLQYALEQGRRRVSGRGGTAVPTSDRGSDRGG